jgi:hypothetical protein
VRGAGVAVFVIGTRAVNRVPVMLGTTNNEGDIFIPAVTLIVGVPLPLVQYTFDMVVQHFWQNAVACLKGNVCTCVREYDTLQSLASMLETFYDHEITYEDILSASLRDW